MTEHRHSTVTQRARVQVQRWANELIDLSRRNTSLYYRPLKRGTLTFIAPSPITIHDLLRQSGRLRIYHPPPSAALDRPWTREDALADAREGELVSDRVLRADVEQTLRNLDRQTQLDLVDRGLESLYMCFGMLRWRESSRDDDVMSPVLFVPVDLRRDSPRDLYRLERGQGDPVVNPSLRVLMAEEFGIEFPASTEDSSAAEDLEAVWDAVRSAIIDRGWQVEPTVVLKRATFHKEAMHRDLLDNLEEVAGHPVLAALADPSMEVDAEAIDPAAIPDEKSIDEVAPSEEARLILDADASQRRAVAAALAGVSFVMDGPPGTGKSQTIANMIGELTASGRSVLFVSEKMAALEVVADRLRARGLGDFILELHSHKVSRKAVAIELGRSLRRHPSATPRLGKAEAAQYRRLREQLTGYAEAVNRVRHPLGRPVHWVLGRLALLHDYPSVPIPAGITAALSAKEVNELSEQFERLARVWAPVEDAETFPWRGLRVEGFTQAARNEVMRLVHQLHEALEHLDALADEVAFAAGMPTPDGPLAAERLANVCAHAAGQPATERSWWSRGDLDLVSARIDSVADAALAQRIDIEALIARHGEDWISIPTSAASRALETAAALEGGTSSLPCPARIATLRHRSRWLHQTVELAEAIEVEGRYVAAALGAPIRERTISEITDLMAVGVRADETVRPEQRWVLPSAAAQVAQAVEVLEPLTADYQERHARLADYFEDGVYDLDLAGLVARFGEVHTGLRKLGRAFRADKQAVASVSRTRRAGKDVRARLPEALELQKLAAALDEREAALEGLLGRFYRPRATDVDAAAHALASLRLAIERLGTEYDAEAVAWQLAGDSPMDPSLGRRSQSTLERLSGWREDAGRAAVPLTPLLLMSPGALRVWAQEAAELTDTFLEALTQLSSGLRDEGTVGELLEDARRRIAVEDRRNQALAARGNDQALLGIFADGLETDVDSARRGLVWVKQLQEAAGGPLPRRSVDQLHGRENPPNPSPLRDCIDTVRKLVDALASHFDDQRSDELRLELITDFAQALEIVDELADAEDQIDVWQTYLHVAASLRSQGWASPLDACIGTALPAKRLVGTLEKALYTAWFDAVCAEEELVARARADDLDALVERFRRLDHELIEDASEWITTACVSRRPKTVVGPSSLIEREAQKKRRHMPVRTLLERAGGIAQALKPCFMMSPLAVSQFLPPGLRFDVVIFDEASQITPADAANCIYRGDQLIVAGDDRQLPPTSFFDVGISDDDDTYQAEQFDDFESVLGLCKSSAQMPTLSLRWHYRSQHEALITFSNYRFYDGELITYPGSRTEGEDLGVELFVVDGVYRRGGPRDNPIEAGAVVERVFHHAARHPNLTLGVVTFSQAQAEAIETLIDRRRQDHPDFEEYFTSDRLDGFFVKNLESVQGDERDIMIFSVGYGFDENGKITLNFGPLTRSGGWRRLNVAITRARRRVEVVSSFRAGQLPTAGSANRGVLELQRYLDYAERGMAALAIDLSSSGRDAESPFEESVLATLRSWGYDVTPQVGTAGYRIDLAVRHPDRPGEFVLGVECDGATYHSSRVARDRDRLRQEVLEGLGWKLHRIWGPAWYRDRSRQEERLRAAVEAAMRGQPLTSGVRPKRRAQVERATEEAALGGRPEWAGPYRIAKPKVATGLRPHDPRALSGTVAAVREILAVEAPMHFEVLARRVAEAYGHRLTSKVRAAVTDAVLTLERQEKVYQTGPWLSLDREVSVRVPTEDALTRRDIEHIPPAELDEAVYALLVDARAASDDELLTQVGRLFGIGRITNRARTVLDDSLARLQDNGRVTTDTVGTYRAV